MDDGPVETCGLSHVGVNMQRIDITCQSENQSLARICPILEDMVRISFGKIWYRLHYASSFGIETSDSPHEHTVINIESFFFLIFVIISVSRLSHIKESIFALIYGINGLDFHPVANTDFDTLVDHEKFFLGMQELM